MRFSRVVFLPAASNQSGGRKASCGASVEALSSVPITSQGTQLLLQRSHGAPACFGAGPAAPAAPPARSTCTAAARPATRAVPCRDSAAGTARGETERTDTGRPYGDRPYRNRPYREPATPQGLLAAKDRVLSPRLNPLQGWGRMGWEAVPFFPPAGPRSPPRGVGRCTSRAAPSRVPLSPAVPPPIHHVVSRRSRIRHGTAPSPPVRRRVTWAPRGHVLRAGGAGGRWRGAAGRCAAAVRTAAASGRAAPPRSWYGCEPRACPAARPAAVLCRWALGRGAPEGGRAGGRWVLLWRWALAPHGPLPHGRSASRRLGPRSLCLLCCPSCRWEGKQDVRLAFCVASQGQR